MHRSDTTQKTQRISYRIYEVAEATGLSEGMVRKEIEAGRLRKTNVGRAVVVLAKDLDAWLKAERVEAL